MKHPSSASNNVVLDNSGNTTISGNATISGSATVGGVAVVTTTGTQTLTNKTLTSPTISGTPVMGASVLTLMTAQNSTSGTFIDFTGIPSWVRRITVMLRGVSTNGASPLLFRLGTSGGVVATGYLGSTADVVGATAATSTTGFAVSTATAASGVHHGAIVISNIASNDWVSTGSFARSDAGQIYLTAGSVSLAAVADRVRITTINGTDIFDAGSINVMYE